MQVLVVYYSRSGNTKKVGVDISKELQCDREELVDTAKRSGIIGWINSGRQARSGAVTKLMPLKNDPSKYDMVIIGTPVWASNMSIPVRTYLTENKDKLKNVAFFCTEGNSGDAKTLDAMSGLCGKKATATLVVKAREISKGDYTEKVKKFASEIKGQ
jgi:flavodoxin